MYTVARELGHASETMIKDRYGHLHDRTEEGGAEVVEFKIAHHLAALGERLERLEAVGD